MRRTHCRCGAAFGLVVGGIATSWVLTMSLGHNEDGRLPYISETGTSLHPLLFYFISFNHFQICARAGTHAPERYVFTFALSCAAVLFALSAYLLFRHLKDRFQDVADFYYGFAHDRGTVSIADDAGGDDGRYNRERILLLGSERMMLSLLPKANYVALGLSLLACACLLFLAVVDLKEARYYHGSASAMFFILGILQGLLLTSLTYALWRVQALHSRRSNFHFYAKVPLYHLPPCSTCVFANAKPTAHQPGVYALHVPLLHLPAGAGRRALHRPGQAAPWVGNRASIIPPPLNPRHWSWLTHSPTFFPIHISDDGLHNVGTVNQYLLTLSLLLHFFCYSAELSAVDITFHLQFAAVDRIIALGGSSSLSTRSSRFFDEEDRTLGAAEAGRRFGSNVISLNAKEYEEDDPDDQQLEGGRGIRFVNKGSSAGREMHEIIPVEVLDLNS